MSGLPAHQRLVTTADISSVLNFKCRATCEYMSVLAKPNALSYSRMTVISPKKISALAVTRNYQKRVVRSLFYEQQFRLGSAHADFVFMVKKSFKKPAYAKLEANLEDMLRSITDKFKEC